MANKSNRTTKKSIRLHNKRITRNKRRRIKKIKKFRSRTILGVISSLTSMSVSPNRSRNSSSMSVSPNRSRKSRSMSVSPNRSRKSRSMSLSTPSL
jgi:hypothetical protein